MGTTNGIHGFTVAHLEGKVNEKVSERATQNMKHQKKQRVFISFSLEQTRKHAVRFAQQILHEPLREHALTIALQGELGSGKTTFMQGFAKGLHIKEKVLSPTFVIIKKYEINSKFRYLYHIDCYRIESEEDIKKLGWDKIVSDPQNLVLIEWPERIRKLLPPKTPFISFETTNKNERKISFSKGFVLA